MVRPSGPATAKPSSEPRRGRASSSATPTASSGCAASQAATSSPGAVRLDDRRIAQRGGQPATRVGGSEGHGLATAVAPRAAPTEVAPSSRRRHRSSSPVAVAAVSGPAPTSAPASPCGRWPWPRSRGSAGAHRPRWQRLDCAHSRGRPPARRGWARAGRPRAAARRAPPVPRRRAAGCAPPASGTRTRGRGATPRRGRTGRGARPRGRCSPARRGGWSPAGARS